LTVDHVPPKGITRGTAMEMRDLAGRLSAEGAARKFELSQDGVKFRSLCSTCNNVRLGSDADPELISLCNHTHALLQARLILPSSITVNVRPMRVLRSIVGHLLATESGRKPNGLFELALASFFLDTSTQLPRAVECFYWPYPFTDQVILRDVALTRLGHGRAPLLFKLLKFYPLSFMLTWERDEKAWDFLMPNLAIHRRLTNNDVTPVAINLRVVPPQRWPEAPTNEAAQLIGGNPMHATPRLPGKRR
jgi:hypothetical protein